MPRVPALPVSLTGLLLPTGNVSHEPGAWPGVSCWFRGLARVFGLQAPAWPPRCQPARGPFPTPLLPC